MVLFVNAFTNIHVYDSFVVSTNKHDLVFSLSLSLSLSPQMQIRNL